MSLVSSLQTMRLATLAALGTAITSGCGAQMEKVAVPASVPEPEQPVLLASGQDRSFSIESPLSPKGVLALRLGNERLASQEDGSGCQPRSTRLRVRVNGLYREAQSDGTYTDFDGDAEWRFCVHDNATILVPIGSEFYQIRRVIVGMDAEPGSRAELVGLSVKP